MALKVCVLTSVHPPFDNRIFYKECVTLRNAGYEVTLIAPHTRNETVEGIRILAAPKPKNRLFRMIVTTGKIIRMAWREKARVYHIHDPELLPGAMVLRLFGKTVIYDMHENVPKALLTKSWLNRNFRWMIVKLFKSLERLFLKNLPVILAENSYSNDYPWLKQSIVVLNMPLVDDLIQISRPKNPEPTIGYIGGVNEGRGSLNTLMALNIVQQEGYSIGWECIGAMTETHQQKMLELIEKYRLSSVTIRGYMLPLKGMEIMATCRVGLALLKPAPNYMESYPTKMFEYMALGLPVLVSKFPLYQQVVEQYQCGVCVNPEDPVEIAQAIIQLIRRPEEAEAMGKRGKEAVISRFNWKTEANKMLDFYKIIINKNQ